jgi:hypothetical protein
MAQAGDRFTKTKRNNWLSKEKIRGKPEQSMQQFFSSANLIMKQLTKFLTVHAYTTILTVHHKKGHFHEIQLNT